MTSSKISVLYTLLVGLMKKRKTRIEERLALPVAAIRIKTASDEETIGKRFKI